MTKHQKRMKDLLEIYAARGCTLEHVAARGILNRKVATLQGYCRKFGIAFADYKPRQKEIAA